jgi:gamma-glutamyltranspeptidase
MFVYTVPLPLGAGNSPASLFSGSTDFSGGTYFADDNAAFWFDTQLQQLVTCPSSGCVGAPKAIASGASTFLTSDGQALYWIGQPGGSSIIKLAR